MQKHLSIWFIIGLQIALFGLLVGSVSVYDVFHPSSTHTVLEELGKARLETTSTKGSTSGRGVGGDAREIMAIALLLEAAKRIGMCAVFHGPGRPALNT